MPLFDAPAAEGTGHAGRREQLLTVALLFYVLTGGVVWWMIHLVVGIALVPAACGYDENWTINVVTVVTAIGAATTIAASEKLRKRTTQVAIVTERNAVLGLTGLLINTMSLILILLEGVPNLVLSACR